jgi:hypothetical protein
MQPDPYRPWRLAVFVVVLSVAVLYFLVLAVSFLMSVVDA